MSDGIPDEGMAYLRDVVARSAPAMLDSGIFLGMYETPEVMNNPVALLQLGMAVVMDKPIYLLLRRGAAVPDNMKRVARGIEYFEHAEDMMLATERLLAKFKIR